MARITLRIPDETLQRIDEERGNVKRSTIVTKILEYVASEQGNVRSFVFD